MVFVGSRRRGGVDSFFGCFFKFYVFFFNEFYVMDRLKVFNRGRKFLNVLDYGIFCGRVLFLRICEIFAKKRKIWEF